MSIEPIVTAKIEKWLPPPLEITSKLHELQAKIIPDCLFKCIFFIILQFSLHFKIISMPSYKSNQSQHICSRDCNKFSAPRWRKNLLFLRQNMKIWVNGAMTQPGLNTMGLHCLPTTLLGVSRLQWVNSKVILIAKFYNLYQTKRQTCKKTLYFYSQYDSL